MRREGTGMLPTSLCDVVGIEYPVIQAGMGLFTSPALAAAVSNAGGLGSIGAWQRPADDLRAVLVEMRDLTDKPFAVNHVVPDLNDDAFAITLDAAPAVISFALDDPGELVQRAHDVGSAVMLQVTTVRQARRAADNGVDIVIAQRGEAGGYGGSVATMALVPQSARSCPRVTSFERSSTKPRPRCTASLRSPIFGDRRRRAI